MPHPYKYFLLFLMFAIPFLIISRKNQFNRGLATALRFGIAVLAVWAYLLLVRLIVVFMDPLLATTPEQIQEIYNGDGAKNLFALLFGWVFGLGAASVSWLFARAWWWLKHKRAAT